MVIVSGGATEHTQPTCLSAKDTLNLNAYHRNHIVGTEVWLNKRGYCSCCLILKNIRVLYIYIGELVACSE